MAYSAGIYYQGDETLAQASLNKFEHICRRLQLSAEDHLLEIGTGWEQGADEVFIRMWHYYLCFCEGGFLERAIHTAQFLAAGPGCRKVPSLQAPVCGASAVS